MVIERLPSSRTIRVAFVATKAIPYATEGTQGLAQSAGMIPAALTRLGVDAHLILPYFKQTAAAIKDQGLDLKKDVYTLRVRLDTKEHKVRIHTLKAPFDPSYPVYFIDQRSYFGRDHIYGEPDDFIRFSLFGKSALALQYVLGEAPDFIQGEEFQGAWAIFHLNRLRQRSDATLMSFFENTRTIFGVHEFAYKGEIQMPNLTESEFAAHSLLEEGLRRADICYTRSQSYRDAIAVGTVGHLVGDVVKDLSANKAIVGLRENDTVWHPGMDLTPDLASDSARRLLTIYLSLTKRSVDKKLVEAAIQTYPELTLPDEVQTPRTKLLKINPEAAAFYDELSEADKRIIDEEIYEGRIDRFSRVSRKRDLENLCAFLNTPIDQRTNLEELIRADHLDWLLYYPSIDVRRLFSPGDLDRIFSLEIDLSESKSVKTTGKKSLPLFTAMGRVKNTNLLQHTINMLKHILLIAQAQRERVAKLSEDLSRRGLSDDKATAGIRNKLPEYIMLSGTFEQLTTDFEVMRAFILAALLHDIGKCIQLEAHPEIGILMTREMKELEALFRAEHLEFLRKLIRHHSDLADSVITMEANYSIIEKLYKAGMENESLSHSFFQALLIIGIADMDAFGQTGRLTDQKIERMIKVYKALITAPDINILKKNLADAGLAPAQWGRDIWNKWVVGWDRETGPRDNRQKRAHEEARAELVKFYRRENITQAEFNSRLGSLVDIFGIYDLITSIPDVRQRARLIFRMVQLSAHLRYTKITLHIEPDQKPILLDILKRENFTLKDTLLDFEHDEIDPVNGSRIIRINADLKEETEDYYEK